MNRCRYCRNQLRFWQVTCPVCKNNVLQLPQISFFAITILTLLAIPTALFIYFPGNNSEILNKKPKVDVDIKTSKTEQQATQKARREQRKRNKNRPLKQKRKNKKEQQN